MQPEVAGDKRNAFDDKDKREKTVIEKECADCVGVFDRPPI